MKSHPFAAIKFILIMTLITGLFYPVIITITGRVFFRDTAGGSIVKINGTATGSMLLGQDFHSERYFWSRPSATGYNPVPSGASNLGPASDTLRRLAESRRIRFKRLNLLPDSVAVPAELVFASGSGLDPDISPEAALLQVNRIVAARKLDENQKKEVLLLIKNLTEEPQFHLLGERRINVFLLNLSLDKIR